jgi:hypothetical protein
VDPRFILLAEKLIYWWHADDPERQLGYASAHDLAGVVTLAQFLLDTEKARLKALSADQLPLPPETAPDWGLQEEE